MKRLVATAASFVAIAILLVGVLVITAGCSGGTPAPDPKASFADYSWSELSAISDEMAGCADGESVAEIARHYNLVGESGKLDGSQSKDVELADGRTVRVTIAGFNHDERADGGGTCGMTLLFEDAVAELPMSNDAGVEETGWAWTLAYGGWPACGARAWLNDDFAELLPDDLRSVMKKVTKKSNAANEEMVGDLGGAPDPPAEMLVESSEDLLWLPSLVEVTGIPDSSSLAEDYQSWASVLKAEGAQYQLFADMGVDGEGAASDVLAKMLVDSKGLKPCSWWLRTFWYESYASVREDGSLTGRDDLDSPTAGKPLGVVPFFAI